MSSVEELKKLGNEALAKEAFSDAVDYYTKAIDIDSSNHILYSNRSAAYASWGKYDKALDDAQKTVALNSKWAKGYSRVAAAFTYLGKYDDARKALNDGLNVDPSNETLKKALNELDATEKKFQQSGNFMNDLFSNPQTKELFSDPALLQKYLQYIQNPGSVPYDPKFETLMNVMKTQFGAGAGASSSSNSSDVPSSSTSFDNNQSNFKNNDYSASKSSTTKKETPQSQVDKEKSIGNEAYKKKNFEIALEHYNKALELDEKNVNVINNIAATYFEMKEYKKCIKECKNAVEIGREVRTDYKNIGRALGRIGNAKLKLGKTDKALEYYKKSLAEYRDPIIVKKVNAIEKEKKQKEADAYLSTEIAEEERQKGNELFSAGKFPDAIKHYTEAIKRNPKDHRIYSNRAACFLKLMEFGLAIKDCDDCLKIDPKFIKAYIRKGHAFLAIKQIFQSQSAFEEALKVDPQNKEAYEGLQSCKDVKSKLTPEQLKEIATNDPEIQAIITDPGMRLILEQMQTDPKATMSHLQNPDISKKIYKLIDAGIIQMK